MNHSTDVRDDFLQRWVYWKHGHGARVSSTSTWKCSKEFYTNEFLGNYKVLEQIGPGKEIEVMGVTSNWRWIQVTRNWVTSVWWWRFSPIPSPPFLPSDPSGVVHIQLNPPSRPTWNRYKGVGLINMKSGLVTNITSGLKRWTWTSGLIMKIQGGLMTSIQPGLPYGIR